MATVTKAQLLKKIAHLESMNDQLMTEITYVDRLMKMIGFSSGLAGVKASAQEILENGYLESDEEFPEEEAL